MIIQVCKFYFHCKKRIYLFLWWLQLSIWFKRQWCNDHLHTDKKWTFEEKCEKMVRWWLRKEKPTPMGASVNFLSNWWDVNMVSSLNAYLFIFTLCCCLESPTLHCKQTQSQWTIVFMSGPVTLVFMRWPQGNIKEHKDGTDLFNSW